MDTYFNTDHQIKKYHLDRSTFDLVDVDRFHNTDTSTVLSYIMTWLLMFLAWTLLGIDIYTCLNILVFHKWSSDSYKPYAYSVAKWIFTGCIIFEFCLLLYHWIWAIHTYKRKNIALAYVNTISRLLYVVRSYNYHCLFKMIEHDNFFDWACFLTYTEIDNALQILIADTPRQVINILTLRYYATDGGDSNDIILNIKDIANDNIMLSVVLSFMVLSVAIWSIFFLKFLFGMILYIPVKAKLRKRDYKSLKKYCCSVVNDRVRVLVFKNHKPKNELIEKGILDPSQINANPLLSSSTSNFNLQDDGYLYKYNQSTASLIPKEQAYNDNIKLHGIANSNISTRNQSYESLPLDDLHRKPVGTVPRTSSNLHEVYTYESGSSHNSLHNPFEDVQKSYHPTESYAALPANPFQDPESIYSRSETSFPQQQPRHFRKPPPRKASEQSLSSLSHFPPPVPASRRSDSVSSDKSIISTPDITAEAKPMTYETFTAKSMPYPMPETESEPDPEAPYPVRGVSMYADEIDESEKNRLRD